MFPTDLHLLCLINIINTTPKKINSGAYSETLNVRICTVKVVPISEPSTIPKACDSVITDPPTSPTTRMFVTVLLCKKKRSEEHTSELQSRGHLVCRLLLAKNKPAIYN